MAALLGAKTVACLYLSKIGTSSFPDISLKNCNHKRKRKKRSHNGYTDILVRKEKNQLIDRHRKARNQLACNRPIDRHCNIAHAIICFAGNCIKGESRQSMYRNIKEKTAEKLVRMLIKRFFNFVLLPHMLSTRQACRVLIEKFPLLFRK